MIQTRFDKQSCRQALSRLDSYIDNELLTESNLEMMQHFERCPDCNREAGERRKLRARVQTAVRDVRVPADLQERVRDRLREARQPHSRRLHLMAIAAAITLCFGSWISYQRVAFVSSPAMSAVLRIGLGNHVHCAVVRQGAAPAHAPIDKLTGEYKDLLPVVRQHIPADLPFVLAHKCEFQGRSFVHLTFRSQVGLLSLIITRKRPGESLGKGVHAETVKDIQVAGFEDRDFLVYTVSGLPPHKNRDVLMALAPSLEQFLRRVGA
jgi:anti-sigma factor (TIGR02949 family)